MRRKSKECFTNKITKKKKTRVFDKLEEMRNSNLKAKRGIGLPQHDFKLASDLDCDRYKAASNPGR